MPHTPQCLVAGCHHHTSNRSGICNRCLDNGITVAVPMTKVLRRVTCRRCGESHEEMVAPNTSFGTCDACKKKVRRQCIECGRTFFAKRYGGDKQRRTCGDACLSLIRQRNTMKVKGI